MIKSYLSIALLILLQSSLFAQKTALIAKSLIDGTGKTIANPVIIIEGGKIVSFTTKEGIPKEATVVDLGDFTLLPGLIDMHVHPAVATDDYQMEYLRSSSAAKALIGLNKVQELLMAGWTAVRVAGDADFGYADIEIKKAIEKGLFVGPHIYGAAHYISVTGGGGDINFLSPEQNVSADGLIANGPDEMRKAVRNEIKYGSDWIKLLVTGAFMSANDNPKNVHVSQEELNAVTEEAARRGVPVMAHAHAAEGIKMAVKAGVRTIEHGSFVDEETMDLMVKHGTYLIPTLTVALYIEEKLSGSAAMAKAVDLIQKAKEGKAANMRLAIKKGVKFGLGTDIIGWPASYSATEFSEYVQLGMTPMQAIVCGTLINAQILKKENDIGSVEVGKAADIIAVKGDPLSDITELQRVKFVMIGGKVVKNE